MRWGNGTNFRRVFVRLENTKCTFLLVASRKVWLFWISAKPSTKHSIRLRSPENLISPSKSYKWDKLYFALLYQLEGRPSWELIRMLRAGNGFEFIKNNISLSVVSAPFSSSLNFMKISFCFFCILNSSTNHCLLFQTWLIWWLRNYQSLDTHLEALFRFLK